MKRKFALVLSLILLLALFNPVVRAETSIFASSTTLVDKYNESIVDVMTAIGLNATTALMVKNDTKLVLKSGSTFEAKCGTLTLKYSESKIVIWADLTDDSLYKNIPFYSIAYAIAMIDQSTDFSTLLDWVDGDMSTIYTSKNYTISALLIPCQSVTLTISSNTASGNKTTSTTTTANSTTTVSGVQVNALPYTVSGLQITNISISGTKAIVTIKNNTGYAIDSLSSIEYKCYNSSGTVLKSGNMYLENINNGESCKGTVYMESGTTKLMFGDANVRKGTTSTSASTTTVSGIQVNSLPYTVSGLQITNISISGTKALVTVKNNAGYAIDSLSSIEYKCYNSAGTVLKTGNMYLENINNGESCKVTVYMDSATTKLIFGTANVRKGTSSTSVTTTTVSGIQVNSLPYTVSGLQITKLSVNGTKATVTVKNNTGYAIDNLSSIEYKCYSSGGTVLKSGNLYLENINSGESCNVTLYMESGTTKIIFGSANVRKGTASTSVSTTTVSGVKVNSLPYTVSGLQITNISINGRKATVTVKNNTGYAIDSLSNIEYKCYNSSGTVLKTGNMYLENINSGESCRVTVYMDSDTSKLIFGSASVRKGTASTSVSTTTISGVKVNTLPYTTSGLQITNISFSGTKATVTVKNNTGYAISSLSSIEYKCYDSSGMIIKSGNLYLEDLKKGESCQVRLYLESGTAKIIFGTGSVRK